MFILAFDVGENRESEPRNLIITIHISWCHVDVSAVISYVNNKSFSLEARDVDDLK